MFTRVLAMELAEQRINVNCIAPGYIKVDSGTSPPSSDFETALIKNTPWGRLGTGGHRAGRAVPGPQCTVWCHYVRGFQSRPETS